MAYTHRHYSTKEQIQLILSAPKVLGADFSEFIKRAEQIKETKSFIKRKLETDKLKKEYWNKVTELYVNKVKEMNSQENPSISKLNSLLDSYNKLCKVFNKDIFTFERLVAHVSPRLMPHSQGSVFDL